MANLEVTPWNEYSRYLEEAQAVTNFKLHTEGSHWGFKPETTG